MKQNISLDEARGQEADFYAEQYIIKSGPLTEKEFTRMINHSCGRISVSLPVSDYEKYLSKRH